MKTWPETIYVEGEGWHGLLMPVRPLDPINPIAAEVRPLEPIGRKVIPA